MSKFVAVLSKRFIRPLFGDESERGDAAVEDEHCEYGDEGFLLDLDKLSWSKWL